MNSNDISRELNQIKSEHKLMNIKNNYILQIIFKNIHPKRNN